MNEFINKVIVFLGDSITYGFPGDPQSSWVNKLTGHINAIPINMGANGAGTGEMLEQLLEALEHPGLSHVHILGGANDAWLDYDHEYSRYHIEQMSQVCAARAIKPVLGLPTPVCTGAGHSFFSFRPPTIADWYNRHRAWLREYAQTQAIPLIDYFSPLCLTGTETGDPRYFTDEVHLNQAGNELMALVALAALGPILA